MFCKNCGNQVGDRAVVCTKCGCSVTGDVQVPNHMVGAILTTLFCCLFGGIIAIMYASSVNTKLAQGDIAGAKAASKTAQTWIIVNISTGIIGGALYFLMALLAAA